MPAEEQGQLSGEKVWSRPETGRWNNVPLDYMLTKCQIALKVSATRRQERLEAAGWESLSVPMDNQDLHGGG